MDPEATVGRKLTEDELLKRAEEMAEQVLLVKGLREKRTQDMQSAQAEINRILDEIQHTAEEIAQQHELRKQGDLFAEHEAKESLAKVGEAAGVVEPFPKKGDGVQTSAKGGGKKGGRKKTTKSRRRPGISTARPTGGAA